MAEPETVTITVSSGDEAEELEVSEALIEMLDEGGETAPEVVADIATLGLAQQAHGAVHHSQGDPSEELAAAESLTMDLFEERFGESYADMTGHSH